MGSASDQFLISLFPSVSHPIVFFPLIDLILLSLCLYNLSLSVSCHCLMKSCRIQTKIRVSPIIYLFLRCMTSQNYSTVINRPILQMTCLKIENERCFVRPSREDDHVEKIEEETCQAQWTKEKID